jgi:hypothetical protein
VNYFYHSQGSQHGPVSWDAIAAAAASGRLQPGDLVWHDGLANWQPAGTIPGLFPQSSPYPGGHPVPPPPTAPYSGPATRRPADDPALKWIVPIGRSGWAIASGYFGLFSLIAIGAPFAILTGILALVDIKKNPEKGGKGRAIFGIAMGVIFGGLYGMLIISVLLSRP